MTVTYRERVYGLHMIWDSHQQWLKGETERLEKKERVPTDADKYRVTWQKIVAYGQVEATGQC